MATGTAIPSEKPITIRRAFGNPAICFFLVELPLLFAGCIAEVIILDP